MKTATVGDLRRILAELPDDQPLMVLDEDGCAAEISEICPATITDKADGRQILLLDFTTGDWYGFEPDDETKIDSRDDRDREDERT